MSSLSTSLHFHLAPDSVLQLPNETSGKNGHLPQWASEITSPMHSRSLRYLRPAVYGALRALLVAP